MVNFWYVLLIVVLATIIVLLWGALNRMKGQMEMIKAFTEGVNAIKKAAKTDGLQPEK